MDRIEFLKTNKYPHIDPAVIDCAVATDPTSGQKFTDWVIRMIVKSGLKQQELPSVTSTLVAYSSIQSRMPIEQRDVNRFSTPFELSAAVLEFMRSETKVESGNSLMVYDKVFEDEKWLVIKPYTYEAYLKYSKSTKWCTTVRATFYNYMASGYLYIIIDKTLTDREAQAKLQFHFTGYSGQFRDALNKEVRILDFFVDNKKVWQAFSKVGEFDQPGQKFFKIIFNPESTNAEAQVAGFRSFGFQVFSILNNPCIQLQEAAVASIVETQQWNELRKIGKLTPSLQVKLMDDAIEYSDHKRDDNKMVKKAFVELASVLESGQLSPCEKVNIKFVEVHPEDVYLIKQPSDAVMELVLGEYPKLIQRKIKEYKEGSVKRKWLVEMAVKFPNILEFVGKSVEFADNDIERIIKSKSFEVYKHLRYIKVMPEKIQLSILRKNGPDYFQYFSNPTNKVRQIYKKLKKRYDAKEKIAQKRMAREADIHKERSQITGYGFNGGWLRSIDGKWVVDSVRTSDGKYKLIKKFLAASQCNDQDDGYDDITSNI